MMDESEGTGVDEVLMEVLRMLAAKGRGKRAERIMMPQEQAAPAADAAPDDAEQMAALEEMLADPDTMPKGEVTAELEVKKKPYGEDDEDELE
jgi:hypothetical protein